MGLYDTRMKRGRLCAGMGMVQGRARGGGGVSYCDIVCNTKKEQV